MLGLLLSPLYILKAHSLFDPEFLYPSPLQTYIKQRLKSVYIRDEADFVLLECAFVPIEQKLKESIGQYLV